MPPKRLTTDMNWQVTDNKVPVKRKPPKPYVEPEWLKEYRRKRDWCIEQINNGLTLTEIDNILKGRLL
jgi:hypothetical protein